MQICLRDKHLYPDKTTSQLPITHRKIICIVELSYGKSTKKGKSLAEAYGVHILPASRAKGSNKHASSKGRMKS